MLGRCPAGARTLGSAQPEPLKNVKLPGSVSAAVCRLLRARWSFAGLRAPAPVRPVAGRGRGARYLHREKFQQVGLAVQCGSDIAASSRPFARSHVPPSGAGRQGRRARWLARLLLADVPVATRCPRAGLVPHPVSSRSALVPPPLTAKSLCRQPIPPLIILYV
jgi:hypothetical protein